MTELPIIVCRVKTPDGVKDYVTCLSHEYVFERGLSREAIIGMLRRPLEPDEEISPAVFVRNRVFVDFMHAVIARSAPQSPQFVAEARRQRDGWIYVIDQRTRTPQDAVPPEDIIGAFEVKGGEVVSGSYRPNEAHMILSADGFFRLGAALQQCLLDGLTLRLSGDATEENLAK